MATEIPEAPTPPEQTREQFNEEFKENWMNARLAHEGLMLEEIQRRNNKVHALADAVRSGTIGKPDQTPTAPTEGEDVGVSIGNKSYHYHYQVPTTATNTTTTQTAETQTSTGMSTLGKVAAAAALVGAGGLGGVAIPLAINAITNNETPAVIQPAEDTDTNAGLRFKD